MKKNFRLEPAGFSDETSLTKLINSAYRGDEAKEGWTHEADLIEGSVRIDENSLTELLLNKNVTILKYSDQDNNCVGCVCLESQGTRLYLGMLSVSPKVQAKGIGKALLEGAELHAERVGATAIVMHVIPQRKELIAWYKRRGYEDTGSTEPFPEGERFGKPRQPLHFIVLKKDLPNKQQQIVEPVV